ncbi:hypothetical protein CHCC14821_0967 [Bacillus paralicheniformis]|nr:hypothetical protein CHCC14821_0967 [Bacillus paralicheniformis]TWM61148.1 hypothetical protein CHCC14814_0691 [Bacillus paralicheniformis]
MIACFSSCVSFINIKAALLFYFHDKRKSPQMNHLFFTSVYYTSLTDIKHESSE